MHSAPDIIETDRKGFKKLKGDGVVNTDSSSLLAYRRTKEFNRRMNKMETEIKDLSALVQKLYAVIEEMNNG